MAAGRLSSKISWEDMPKGIATPVKRGSDTYFLRDDIKKILELKDKGHTSAEIAKMTGYAEDAVEWATNYAMKYMRKTTSQ